LQTINVLGARKSWGRSDGHGFGGCGCEDWCRSAASAARPENFNLRRSSAFHCEAKRCIVSPLLAKFFHEVFAMSNSVEDLQMLRLIRAFQKLTDQGTRRTVLLYVEDQVQKQQAEGSVECSTKSPPRAGSTTADS
jgi:hypothetical protein